MSNIDTLTRDTITDEMHQEGILVIDFWAPWRGPCRTMAPQFEGAAQMRPGYRFAKVNVDEQPTVASALQIRSIPTIVVINDGEGDRRQPRRDRRRPAGRRPRLARARPGDRRRAPGRSSPMTGHPHSPSRWPLERVLFALAGSMTLIAAVLGAFVSRWFLLLAVLVGVNQWLYVVLGACPASIVLRRTCRMRSAIYPNPIDNRQPAAREEVTV
jgi:thioredoxin